MYQRQPITACRSVFRFLFSMLFLSASFTHLAAQQIPFCGVHVQPSGNFTGGQGQGPAIQDRFGNSYSEDEIRRQQAKGLVINCATTDIFQLNFIGNFAADDQATICQVFKDLSDIVSGGSTVQVPINIQQEPMSYGAPATATDFFMGQCGLVNSSVLQLIRTGQNNLPIGVAAGVVHIRVNPTPATTWFSLQDELNAPINGTQVDLYSVTMHEALHVLGIASMIGLNGGSIAGNNIYSNWDRFLTAGNAGAHLIVPNPAGGGCCSSHVFNTTAFPGMPQPLSGNCSINAQFFDGANNIAPVNNATLVPVSNNDMANKLSHCDITCGNQNYVMHPAIAAGTTRRPLSAAEIRILCNLGYPTAGCNQTCVAIAQDDNIQQPIILTGAGANNPMTIPFSTLLANDAVPATGVTVALVPNCGLGAGIQVQIVGNAFQVTGLTPGAWSFCYSISGCNGAVCDEGTVNILVQNTLLETHCQSPDCNLVCFGDFEDFIPNVGQSTGYNPQLGLPNFSINTAGNSANTPDIGIDASNNGHILSWANLGTGGAQEVVRVPISSQILPGCTVTIQFQAYSTKFGSVPAAPFPLISVYGITSAPCNIINEPVCNNTNAPFSLCGGVTGICMGEISPGFDANVGLTGNTFSGINWGSYEITWTNNTANNLTINELLIYGSFGTGGLGNYRYFLNNLSVISSCSSKINIEPTVLQQCINGQAIIQYDVCLENPVPNQSVTLQLQAQVPQLPGVSIVAGGGFNGNGMATITLPDQVGDPNCTTVTLTLNIGSNIQPGTQVTVGMIGASANACLNLEQNNADAVLNLEVCTPDPQSCNCPPGANSFTVGKNTHSITLASQSTIPQDIDLSSACIAVNGQLIWDIDVNVSASHFIMNEGAELIIPSGVSRSFTDNLFDGCLHMWRGITVRGGGAILAERNRIYDAQYAIRAQHNSTIRIVDNTFDRDYVGLYVPPSTGGFTQNVFDQAITENDFTCSAALKTPYSGQTPVQGQFTHVGILLNNVAGIAIGINNVANGISNGVFAFRSSFTMDQCQILNLIQNTNSDRHLYGVLAENCGQAEITNCFINQAANGIYADNSNLVARRNRITTFSTMIGNEYNAGVIYFNGTGRSIRIQGNTILASRDGITVSNCTPAVGLRVRDNIVDLHPGTPIWRNGIFMATCSRGWVRGNTITNGSGSNSFTGLYLLGCNSLNVMGNTISDQYNGVYLFGCAKNYLVGNTVIDASYSGSFATTGFNAINSRDSYCSNSTNGQSYDGFYFEGACSPSRLTCNRIGSADNYGLELWADFSDPTIGTVISPQLNRGNLWTGGYGSGFGAYNASTDADDINLSRFRMPAFQIPTWSTGSGQTLPWFGPVTGSALNCLTACPVPVDPDDDYPHDPNDDSEDGYVNDGDIRAAQGTISGPGILWMSQHRLYERIKKYPGLLTQHYALQSFNNTVGRSTLGQLYDVRSELDLLQSRDAYSQYYLADVQADVIAVSNELKTVRTNGSNGNDIAWRNTIKALQSELAWLMGLYYGYEEAIEQLRHNEVAQIKTHNGAISENSSVCAANEKTLNALVLDYGMWKLQDQSSTVVNAVKAIADQCPQTGGFSVYAARTIYKYFEPLAFWDDDQGCLTDQERVNVRPEPTQKFMVTPNPANQTLTLGTNQILEPGAIFELISLTGKLMRSAALDEGATEVTIRTEAMPSGVYFYRVRAQNSVLQTGKVVIAH